jgi:hypothetical protein
MHMMNKTYTFFGGGGGHRGSILCTIAPSSLEIIRYRYIESHTKNYILLGVIEVTLMI